MELTNRANCSSERFFSPDPMIRRLARQLYEPVARLPIISPHGHVAPALFSRSDIGFGSPVDLFVHPDHYVIRMLYSQGIRLEDLGIGRLDGGEVEKNHRKIWRIFCENFHLFRATPTGLWINQELGEVFDIREKLDVSSADRVFDQLIEKLCLPEFTPRALFDRFNIEVLCTTDSATDTLEDHRMIRESGWNGRILPTFRPDSVVNILASNWKANINRLSERSGIEIVSYPSFIRALEERRTYFRSQGAVSTDHDVLMPYTIEMSCSEVNALFERALKGTATQEDAGLFSAHILMEMARMSYEDGLVMQIHAGSMRNHNDYIMQNFGPDKGGDIPVQMEYTRNLHALLNKYGNNHQLKIVLFTLDESAYSRELAVLAGFYPALKLGPPWWFHDSLNGIARYFNQVMETAGLYNIAGFNDDTRAFCSIPARHDVWRRSTSNWLAGLVARQIVDMEDAGLMNAELASGLAKRTYGF